MNWASHDRFYKKLKQLKRTFKTDSDAKMHFWFENQTNPGLNVVGVIIVQWFWNLLTQVLCSLQQGIYCSLWSSITLWFGCHCFVLKIFFFLRLHFRLCFTTEGTKERKKEKRISGFYNLVLTNRFSPRLRTDMMLQLFQRGERLLLVSFSLVCYTTWAAANRPPVVFVLWTPTLHHTHFWWKSCFSLSLLSFFLFFFRVVQREP